MRTNTAIGDAGDAFDGGRRDKAVQDASADYSVDGVAGGISGDDQDGDQCEDQSGQSGVDEPEACLPDVGQSALVRPSFTNSHFIQTVVSQAIAVVTCASEERGEFIPHAEFNEPTIRHLDKKHEKAFHSACNFLTEYFDGARDALSRENRSYVEWADGAEREFRKQQQRLGQEAQEPS